MFKLYGSENIKKTLDYLTEQHCISKMGNIYFFDNGQVKLEEGNVVFSLKSVYLPVLASKIISINGVSASKIEVKFLSVYAYNYGHITLDVTFPDSCVKNLYIGIV